MFFISYISYISVYVSSHTKQPPTSRHFTAIHNHTLPSMLFIYQRMLTCFLLWGYFASAYECFNDLRLNPFPQFQIIAAAKTGSTSLYSYLCEHPSINCAAKKKELNLLRTGSMTLKSREVKNKFSLTFFILISTIAACEGTKVVSATRF